MESAVRYCRPGNTGNPESKSDRLRCNLGRDFLRHTNQFSPRHAFSRLGGYWWGRLGPMAGGPVTASSSFNRRYSPQRIREYHWPRSSCGLIISGAATCQSSTDGRLALAHRRQKSLNLPWLISSPLSRMKVVVFGNSGSGKSTYARAIAALDGLAHLDSDSIVWGFGEPGKIAVQRPDEVVAASLHNFIDSHAAWVIEGCYGELVR